MRRNLAKQRRTKEYTPNITCAGKRFFATEAEAHTAANQRMAEHLSLSLAVYQCQTCRQWHLTSMQNKK